MRVNNHIQNYELLIFIVDTSRNDALYWKNDFLRVIEIEDAYTNTSKVLNMCKKFISKQSDLEKTSKVSFLNKSVQYFETHDNFEVDDFIDKNVGIISGSLDLQAFMQDFKLMLYHNT